MRVNVSNVALEMVVLPIHFELPHDFLKRSRCAFVPISFFASSTESARGKACIRALFVRSCRRRVCVVYRVRAQHEIGGQNRLYKTAIVQRKFVLEDDGVQGEEDGDYL